MQTLHRAPFPPLLVLAIGILIASTASIMIRYAQAEAPSLVIAAYRLTIASLLLAPIAASRRREELAVLTRKELGLAVLSGLFLALHFATWISSLKYTTVASSAVLVATIPLWVALISPFTLKEPMNRLAKTGMLLALAGGFIVALSDTCVWSGIGLRCPSPSEFFNGRAFLGDLLALAGALMGASYLLIGRSLRAKMSLLSYIFVVYSMAAVVLLMISLGAGLPAFGYSAQTYLWFILLALGPQLLGHTSFNWSLRYVSAGYVSISLLGESIGSTILAYLLLGEAPAVVKVFGAILILAGIYIASQSEKNA